MIIRARTNLVAEGVDGPGWVATSGDRVTQVGAGVPDQPADLVADVVLPGFLDLHVHGGGGHDSSRSITDLGGAAAFHLGHGTTATLVSLVTAPPDQLCHQLAVVAAAAESQPASGPRILGAHLEGPFLSHARCGAQNPSYLLHPDDAVLDALLEAARGCIQVVTLAPELPGALPMVDRLVAAGVVVAIGHTDATYDEARAAIDHGATLATHLFNGMPPLHHREPGPVTAALAAGLACELINDGVHLHPAMLRLAQRSARPILVTDAMDATGMGDGRYELGGRQVNVRDGQARLVQGGSLAGSTLTMDAAVRRAVRDGWTLEEASRAASRTPAQTLGVDDEHGTIAVGRRADLVLLTSGLALEAVVSGGVVVDA